MLLFRGTAGGQAGRQAGGSPEAQADFHGFVRPTSNQPNNFSVHDQEWMKWSYWSENEIENLLKSLAIHSLPKSLLFPATREFSRDGQPQGETRPPYQGPLRGGSRVESGESANHAFRGPPFELLSSNSCLNSRVPHRTRATAGRAI
jgi:hypothetical protein